MKTFTLDQDVPTIIRGQKSGTVYRKGMTVNVKREFWRNGEGWLRQMARYQVQEMKYDATRPFAVLDTGRSWNRVQGRYETREQATRRARDLNRRNPS